MAARATKRKVKARGRAKVQSKKRVRAEHTEQAMLVARVRHFYPFVIIAAVPNGGRRSKSEAGRLKAEGVLAGMPDLLLLEPRGGFFGCAIEMKRVGGRLSPKQEAILGVLEHKGYRIIVGDQGVDVAFALVESYLSKPLTKGRQSILD